METVTLRAVEKVVAVKEKGSVVKRALNRLYDEAVAQGILQENNVKKLLVTVREKRQTKILTSVPLVWKRCGC